MVRYYKKKKRIEKKLIIKILGLSILFSGIGIAAYIFFPLLSWQIYFAPVFASQEINAPIPKNTVVSKETISSLISEASQSILGVDSYNASNWFPGFKYQKSGVSKTPFYKISIPSINITDAIVSSVDTDLTSHLVNYGGTAIPPESGNAVIFGHSTLPQLYNAKNYKTIFSYLYKLNYGDEIIVNTDNLTYKYIVENITVVDPDNTSVLEQNYDDSFLTLITCTPPGTIWKRLVVKARIKKI